MNDKTSAGSSNTCYEGRGGASGRHCNFYPNCVCGDRDALGKAPATDVAALFAVQQENKRLRAALAAISCGTPDLMPPYRAMGAQQLREIASKALGNRPPENETRASPFDRAAILADPRERRISMSFETQEQYEAALVFLDMADTALKANEGQS